MSSLHFLRMFYIIMFSNLIKKCFLLVSTLILELQVIYIPHFYSIIDCIFVIINIINTSVESANPFASKWICFNLSLESHSFLLIFSPHKTRESCFCRLSSWVDNIFFHATFFCEKTEPYYFFMTHIQLFC